MAEPRFATDWRLEVEHDHAAELAKALAPETREHARLSVEAEVLVIEGEGPPGESLHTLDDVLACLTGAMAVDEVD